ncbi:hypothetical protein SAMD00019534_002050 [Acytostelium subglobosum LB1]|uniref:hypothetical protein n=1 Tax=Acytostelium subglobosum LB1 TaxID=1410327 RepID=UPI0006449EA3|nr:hypothetical protein SAMD00019534_002050 [Acytostelium subglobosum LB1]GAM17030.1 hypothetical protein SAMD00019534_002050 [Acytostelium subglobosum LB1]|eukprot:XP_012759092.1 hypothetical protein SAMD00019534_002050 [Acytostelium subglobosum LB1]
MDQDTKPSLEEELSFDLTFGEPDLNEHDIQLKRELMMRRQFTNGAGDINSALTSASATSAMAPAIDLTADAKAKDKRTRSEKSDRHAVLISSRGDRFNLGLLLKQLEECGPVRAHHFRDRQNFGFVQFLDSESADNAIDRLNNKEIDGQLLQVERIKRITPGKDPRFMAVGSPQCSSLPTQLPSMLDHKPDSTLVLKNLPFNLKQVQLQELLETIIPAAPQSVNFHYDNVGVFRGMAFVKYRLLDDAVKVFDALNGADVHGRRVRLEYKRKVNKSNEVPAEVLEDEKLRRAWEQLKEFKDDAVANELTFSTFTGIQRMYIHNMAEKLKLVHTSVGEEPNRSIIITKQPKQPGSDMPQFLSTSPTSYIGQPMLSSQASASAAANSFLSSTPTNSYTPLSSTPTSSMFGKPMEQMSSSFNNNPYLRSMPINNHNNNHNSNHNNNHMGGGGLTHSGMTGSTGIKMGHSPSIMINDSNRIAASWEKSPPNSFLSTPPSHFTTGFGMPSRDRSTSDLDLSTSPNNSSLWSMNTSITGNSSIINGFGSIGSLNSYNNFLEMSSYQSNPAPPISSSLGTILQQQQHYNISNSINIISNNNHHHHNNNGHSNSFQNTHSGAGSHANSFNNNIIGGGSQSVTSSSPVYRQPRGPDGTKGFSDVYRSARKVTSPPLSSSPVMGSYVAFN